MTILVINVDTKKIIKIKTNLRNPKYKSNLNDDNDNSVDDSKHNNNNNNDNNNNNNNNNNKSLLTVDPDPSFISFV